MLCGRRRGQPGTHVSGQKLLPGYGHVAVGHPPLEHTATRCDVLFPLLPCSLLVVLQYAPLLGDIGGEYGTLVLQLVAQGGGEFALLLLQYAARTGNVAAQLVDVGTPFNERFFCHVSVSGAVGGTVGVRLLTQGGNIGGAVGVRPF